VDEKKKPNLKNRLNMGKYVRLNISKRSSISGHQVKKLFD
jgi:hypothetical protein